MRVIVVGLGLAVAQHDRPEQEGLQISEAQHAKMSIHSGTLFLKVGRPNM